jgi:hypothetical protein
VRGVNAVVVCCEGLLLGAAGRGGCALILFCNVVKINISFKSLRIDFLKQKASRLSI